MKIVTFALFLIGWYYFMFTTFIYKGNSEAVEFPHLRARLGTILSHSSDHGGEEHLYCYYPKQTTRNNGNKGENILKRVGGIEDCKDWFGAAIFNEGFWVSEIEKIWWNRDQKEKSV